LVRRQLPTPQNFPEYLLVHAQFTSDYDEFVESWALSQRSLRPLLARRDYINDTTWFSLYAKGHRTPEMLASALVTRADTPARQQHVITTDHRIGPLWWPVVRGMVTPDQATTLANEPSTPKRILEVLATSPHYDDTIRATASKRLGGYYLLAWLADAPPGTDTKAQVRALLESYADWYKKTRHMGTRTCEDLLDLFLDRNPQYLPIAVNATARAPRLAAARCIHLTSAAHARKLAKYQGKTLQITTDSHLLYELYANPAVDPALCRRFATARAAVRNLPLRFELANLEKRLAGRIRAIPTSPDQLTDDQDLSAVIGWVHKGAAVTRPAAVLRLARNPNLGDHAAKVTTLLTNYRTRRITTDTEYQAVCTVYTANNHSWVPFTPWSQTVSSGPEIPGTWRIESPRPQEPATGSDSTDNDLACRLEDLQAALEGLNQSEYSTEVIDVIAANLVCPALGHDPRRWELFFSLGQNFAGTLFELLDACVALTS
jgi:hypothetical protein